MSIKIGVIGAGSWGTVLAGMLGEKGNEVILYGREPEVAASVDRLRINTLFMPDMKLPETVKATADIAEAATQRDIIVMAAPSQHTRATFEKIAYLLHHGTYVVLASKGVENGTLKMMHQVAEESLPDNMHKNIFVLSGPTFAKELALKMPSAAVVAGHNGDGAAYVQQLFALPYFRVYRSFDIVGVELGGALKNVIAIAVGILEGMKLGHNSQSAIMTRAIAEITRLVVKMGGNPFTVTGLSGVGDLILTCTGDLSRNRQVGIRLGRGEKLDAILSSTLSVAEGVTTAISAYHLAKTQEVQMPIVETVYKVLHENADIREAFTMLMGRSLKEEIYGF